MIIEVQQMLSTAHVVLDGEQVAMKPTHVNHPCSVWIRNTKANYMWAFMHAKSLCDEYNFRTGKVHASSRWLDILSKAPKGIVAGELEPFALAMPDEFKVHGVFDQTKAYRLYLNTKFKEWATRTDKTQIKVEWTNRQKPIWVDV
jgi:hypothetical protein